VVTDPVEGRSLISLVAERPLPPEQARSLIGQAATALETARKRGVHHLRLRPSTLRLSYAGEVVVTGLAIDAAQAGTYLEQASAAAREDSVDLVRLLYTALTGSWPGQPELAGGLPLAQRTDAAPVAPAARREGIPADLDQLCTATLGPYEDGPFTPGELVRQLQPWEALIPPARPQSTAIGAPVASGDTGEAAAYGAAEADATSGQQATSGNAVLPTPGRGIAMSGPLPAIIPPEPQAAPGAQSEPPTAADGAPPTDTGTDTGADTGAESSPQAPPRPIPAGQGWDLPSEGPATAQTAQTQQQSPPSSTRSRPGAIAALGATARRATSSATAAARARAGSGGGGSSGPSGAGFGDAPGKRDRFNPTPWVILAMVAVLIVALVLALGSLSDARTSFDASKYAEPSPTASSPSPSPEPTTSSPSPTASETPTPEPVEITFTEAKALDPSAGVGDNDELAGQAIDGDADTIWRSLRYDNPTYGMKPGLGFAVKLEDPTEVTAVTLDVQGEGGKVQIRNTSPDDPSGGEVLAEGSMGPEKTYELSEPTELEWVVLWFPELPEASSDGRNRIELAEITATGQSE